MMKSNVMRGIRRRAENLTNPSLLISMVALFVALGGVSYAAATIGSSEIKNNSVRSKDVKNGDLRGKDLKANTIGGRRVLESSLGQVPSAAQADNATNAANAGTLDGVDSAQYLQVKTRVRTNADTGADNNYADDSNLLQLSNLAAGQYTVSAKLQVSNDGVAETTDCDLVRDSGALTQLDTSQQVHGAGGTGASQLNYTLIGTFTASAAGTDDVFLRCGQVGADDDADEMRIVATLVN